jgi:hypothetical protein
MPAETDRYDLNPLDGPAQMKEWTREIDRRISALEGAPLVGSNFTAKDLTGAVRVVAGRLPDDTYGMEIDGGKVRALEIDAQHTSSQNVTTLTNLAQVILTLEFTPPVWALNAYVLGWATVQISDTTGAASQLLTGQVSIDGNLAQRVSMGLTAVGQTASVTPLHMRALSAPITDPIDVHVEAYLAAGTNTANRFNLSGLVLYTR